jgi:hypothetical protein
MAKRHGNFSLPNKEKITMPIEDFIIDLFCRVDDALGAQPKHPQEKLCRSEVVTVGLLGILKNASQRRFWSWLKTNYPFLFPRLPDRTRLFRRLSKLWELTTTLLADPTVFGVVDTYGIELIHPYREGRTEGQIGRKGLSNHRWIVGAKLALLVNQHGRAVAWSLSPANVHDTYFLSLAYSFAEETRMYADTGFRSKEDTPQNLKLCHRGECNDRMLVETVLSLLTRILGAKKMLERSWQGVIRHVAYLLALFNLLVDWQGQEPDAQGRVPLALATFCL